jgi:hypothetical protein
MALRQQARHYGVLAFSLLDLVTELNRQGTLSARTWCGLPGRPGPGPLCRPDGPAEVSEHFTGLATCA